MSPPKYLDPLLLAAALVVFLLGGFSLLGFAVGAGVWVAQRAVQHFAARRAAAELAGGNRQRAMGIVAGTTLGRVWLMATAVLLVGLADVMLAAFFTISFAAQGISHLFGEPEGQGIS
jgi:hypothetical protein